MNGDGVIDILHNPSVTNCTVPSTSQRSYINNLNHSYLLSGVSNSLGGSLSIEYIKSTSLDNTGNDSVGDLGFNLWVVSSLTIANGMDGANSVTSVYTYNYSDGLYDYWNRDFRGFGFAQETRPNGSIINHYFHQDEARKGRELKTEVYDSQDNIYQRKEYNWSYTSIDNYFITNLMEENTSTFDGQVDDPKITRTNYIYDEYGNVIERNSLGDLDISGDERYESYSYVYNTSSWIVGTPKHYQLLDSDNSTMVRESYYSYDNLSYGESPTKGSLTTKEDYLNTGSNPVTTYDYDSHGNLASETDPNGYTTQYGYGIVDTTFTLLDEIINPKGHITYYTYDLGLGKPLSVTDSNGFAISYTYDVFGRLSKEIRPYDSSEYPTKEYIYELNGSAPGKIKTFQREDSGTSNTFDSYQFYDGFANNVLAKQESEDTHQIRSDTFYDKVVRVDKRSNPYKEVFNDSYTEPDTSVNKTEITYDPIDRISVITNPDSTKKNHTYKHWNLTILDENGNKIINTLDAYGQITHVYEYVDGGIYVTAYEYDPAGNLIKITDNEGNVFTFTYDTLGRKIGMTDPDMGTWNYTYDPASNLITQRDNRSVETNFLYDELNRVTNKTSSAESIGYTYDEQLDGTLSRIDTTDYTRSFAYDNRFRITEENKTIDDTIFIITYSYDSMDRLKLREGSNDINVTLSYTPQNQLKSIHAVIDDTTHNELNTILNRTYANSLVSNFFYDLYNLRLTRIQTSDKQNLQYTYDNVSNVLSITDNINSRMFWMLYDQLNRLIYTRMTESGAPAYIFNYSYNSIGNMMSILVNENDTSVFNYGDGPVHAPEVIVTNYRPTTPEMILCDGNPCEYNQSSHTSLEIMCLGSEDADSDDITYSIDSLHEYSISDLEDVSNWWNYSWQYRKRIMIENNNVSYPIPANYTIGVTLDTTGDKYLDNGSDVRIVHNLTGINTETGRINLTPFNSEDTKIYFKTMAEIPSGETENTYFIYYDNPNASKPPENISKIFMYDESFENCPVSEELNGACGWIGHKNFTVVNTKSYNGSRSVKVDGSSPTDIFIDHSIDFDNLVTGVSVTFYMYVHGSDERGVFNIREDDTVITSFEMYDGNLKDGGVSFGSYDDDMWYKVEYKLYPDNTHDVYVNDVLERSNIDNQNDFSNGVNYISLGAMAVAVHSTLNHHYWDFITVKKLLYPEPTVSLDEEETAVFENTLSYYWTHLGNHTEGSKFNWDITEITNRSGVNFRCKAIDTAGSGFYSEYLNPLANLTIEPPKSPRTNNFSIVHTDGSERVFRFYVTNLNTSQDIDISWNLNTGENVIESESETTLNEKEPLFLFIYNDYTSPGAYLVNATALTTTDTDSEWIYVNVTA